MLIVSSVMVSPGAAGVARFFIVILTARSAVFICGETEVIVPETIVPARDGLSVMKPPSGLQVEDGTNTCAGAGARGVCAQWAKFEKIWVRTIFQLNRY